MRGAFAVKHVEGIAHESEPVVGRPDRAGVFAVVVGQRIRHDEMRHAADGFPERQLIPVIVRIVEETALLDDQPPRVHARPVAAISAGRSPSVVSKDRTALRICSRSSSAVSSKCLTQRQPCEHTSNPDARLAAAAGGWRSMASAQPKIVNGRPRAWNRRINRQKPTRLPYSNMLSPARSRPRSEEHKVG